eukprot:2426442-Rhodomonas_salina.1
MPAGTAYFSAPCPPPQMISAQGLDPERGGGLKFHRMTLCVSNSHTMSLIPGTHGTAPVGNRL